MEETITLHDKKFRIMIPAEKIDEAVSAVAARINADYADKQTPLFVGVLNGSFMFMSDLIKKIEFQNELSFVKLASYEGTASTGEVKSLIGLNTPIEGRHVIIVEDILDSGNTLYFLKNYFMTKGASSVTVVTLLDKPARRTKPIAADLAGFEVPDEFVVGYGLDYAQKYRNMPYIGVLKPEVYSK